MAGILSHMLFVRRFSSSASAVRRLLRNMHSKKSFNSFVFFDLETTGLQRPIEITELCFVGVLNDQLDSCCTASTIPRLLDKLTVCVRPTQHIEHGAELMTGLSNSILEDYRGFDIDLAATIKSFLVRQKAPCCLVAHGGDRYDFDILASEFSQVGLEFPSSVEVSDSCSAIRAMHKDLKAQDTGQERRSNGSSARISHSLSSLYKRYTGKDIEGSHTAEGDTLALLELVLAKPEVKSYIEKGARQLGRTANQNNGLAFVRERTSLNNEFNESKIEESEVLEEYFSVLEEEGVLKTKK